MSLGRQNTQRLEAGLKVIEAEKRTGSWETRQKIIHGPVSSLQAGRNLVEDTLKSNLKDNPKMETMKAKI
jgi:hypothetical protein